MCETRDLGIKWLFWHTLILEGEVRIDMKKVCPKDVKNMLLQQARIVYWKKWVAKHEYEELVVKPTQPICVSSAAMKSLHSRVTGH